MSEQEKLSPWTLIYRESSGDLSNYWPDDVWVVTERLTVPGGWIVRVMIDGAFESTQITTTFVPCRLCAMGIPADQFGPLPLHKSHWFALSHDEDE